MADRVTAVVLGGTPRVLDNVETVADVKEMMNVPGYQATVNGDTADDNTFLEDFSYVSLSAAVKGGR